MDQTTSIANAVTATSITVLGVATGLNYDVLLAGFAGGLVSLSYLNPTGVWRRIWTPITATLTAGYVAPVANRWFSETMTSPDDLALRMFSAFVIGVLTQALIPLAFKLVQKKADSIGEQIP